VKRASSPTPWSSMCSSKNTSPICLYRQARRRSPRLSDSRKEIARPPASLGSAGSNDDPDAAKRLGHRLLDRSETLLSPSPRRQCPAVSGHRSGYQGGLLDPFIASMNRLDAWKSSLFFDIDFQTAKSSRFSRRRSHFLNPPLHGDVLADPTHEIRVSA